MLKYQIASDLHLEFMPGLQFVRHLCNSMLTDAEILIIAGDLSVSNNNKAHDKLTVALNILCKHYQFVIYVPGNHEYYYSNLEGTKKYFDVLRTQYVNLIITDEPTYFPQFNIIACTLWFDKGTMNPIAYTRMSDATLIDNKLEELEQHGKEHATFIDQHVNNETLVITHHLPSYSCVNKKFNGDPLNAFFVNTLASKIIKEKKPVYWIHGHSHDYYNAKIYDTQVIRNPFGYYHDVMSGTFKTHLIIER